jgi:hypothetical protein
VVRDGFLAVAVALITGCGQRAAPRAAEAPSKAPQSVDTKAAQHQAALRLVRAICPKDVFEDGETIGCATCSTSEGAVLELRRTLEQFVQGHFTSRDADETVAFMSSLCGGSGSGEDYVVSRLSDSSASARAIGAEAVDQAMTFRRHDGRTGIVLHSIFARQGEVHSVVRVCSIEAASGLHCESLLSGANLAGHCPPDTDPRTDVDRISVSLADVDGDGLTDISLGVEYSSWPALTQEEAEQLALSTGCAVDVPSLPTVPVPVPTRGTSTLLYMNRADRFEPTTDAIFQAKAIGAD